MLASDLPPYDPDVPADAGRLGLAARSVEGLTRRREQLLPALLAAQQVLGWLPREAITQVAAHLRVPVSEVYANATGYSELRLDRPVPGTWQVCTGVACDLAGARALLEALGAAHPGCARPADCQFLCALAPVAVDEHERLYGRVTVDRILARAPNDEAPR